MAKKRGQGMGSIAKCKDGRYMVRLPIDGVRRLIGYARTAEEADRLLTEAKAKRDRGTPFTSGQQTLTTFAEQWLAMKKPGLKETAYTRYESTLRIHILPTLGRTPLVKLAPQQVQRLYAARRGAPVQGKRTQVVGATTVRRVHDVLHNLLEDARRYNLVAINVCDNVTTPKPNRTTMRVLTLEQVGTLLEAIQGDRLEALYVLDFATGMRQGEILALKWSGVDLATGTLRITETLKWRNAREYYFTPPKTRGSARTIVLAPVAVEALRAHRARQAQERLRLGVCWQDRDLVFCAEDGSPLKDQGVRHRHKKTLARAGLPRVRFHDIRHTYATLQSEYGGKHGVDLKAVSTALGHSSTTITADLYTHVTTGTQQRIATSAEEIITNARQAARRR
ncbi:MAG: site-specific integrase [Ktedonobacterales bacterium]|nr:site-specific integrase [Ktedonobacterales bacterium]